MNIRAASFADIDEIMTIYDSARNYMRAQGNNNQWINGYPQRSLIENDIQNGHCFVICSGVDDGRGSVEKVYGVFAFIIGKDPTYSVIEQGAWLNDEPYGTIHRIGSDGKQKGLLKAATEFCMAKVTNIRADTHRDNLNMQNLLEKNGFKKCGIIYVADGSERIAYHLICDKIEARP